MTDLEFIEATAKELNFTNVDIQIKHNPTKGDGYMGCIKFIQLEDKTINKKLQLVLKVAPTNDLIREKTPIRNAYLREIYMYTKIFPEFLKFQANHNIADPFKGFATVFNTSETENNEMVLMEDLKQSGYRLWNRKIPMDAKHVETVFLEYARFHSVSLAMRELVPEKFQHLTESLVSIFGRKTRSEIFDNISTKFKKAYEALGSREFVIEALKNFEKEAPEFVFEKLRDGRDHLVITHGDCWCNNMMFKYEDEDNAKIPTKVSFLDWQTSKMGSPVMDLSYFLYICSPKIVLDDFKKYLLLYHKTVCDNLKKFGCDAKKVFPFRLLESHWRKYSKFGLYMCFINLENALIEAENAPDITELAKEGKDFLKEINAGDRSEKVVKEYNRRITDLITFMADNGLL